MTQAEQLAKLQFLIGKLTKALILPNGKMTIFVSVYKLFTIAQLLALGIFEAVSLMREI